MGGKGKDTLAEHSERKWQYLGNGGRTIPGYTGMKNSEQTSLRALETKAMVTK